MNIFETLFFILLTISLYPILSSTLPLYSYSSVEVVPTHVVTRSAVYTKQTYKLLILPFTKDIMK